MTFWARSATDAVTIPLVEKFNATHPHLKIVLHLIQPNEASSELATAIRAGDAPDLVGFNDINVPAFSREGALMNLAKYVDALSYKSLLSPGHMKLAQFNGQDDGVPYLADLSVVWHSPKLFKEAGISGPPTRFAAMLTGLQRGLQRPGLAVDEDVRGGGLQPHLSAALSSGQSGIQSTLDSAGS